MKHKQLLLGDEAFALGAINAGLSGAYAYPGTPSTEILEYVQQNVTARQRAIHSHWSSNEKTAMEAALGMSFCGKRAIVAMKHVGLNVAADAFVNSAMTGANGGLIVVSADDPSMHSSQNEQDSRYYGSFALTPILEPTDQQEAYDMARYGFNLSEQYGVPVLLRLVTRLSHSRAGVDAEDNAEEENSLHYPKNKRQWVLMPGNSRRRYPELISTYDILKTVSDNSPFNRYEEGENHSVGIVASGIAYNYVIDAFGGRCPHPIVKVSQYPLPMQHIRRLFDCCETILIVEEGQPVIEQTLKGLGTPTEVVKGKLSGRLPRTGELTVDRVREALELPTQKAYVTPDIVLPRPPALCQGCGHRDVYNALNKALTHYDNAKVFGDIGCYTLGYLSPFHAIDTVVDMGASITMAKGAADAGQHPAVAVIGDSTFTHSGMTGLLDAINENSPITVIISDNLTTGMTGGQDSQGTGKLRDICIGLGADPHHVIEVESLPRNVEAITELISQEIDYRGLSVILSARECIQTARRHAQAKH